MKGINQFVTGFTGSIENMTLVQAKDGKTIVKGKITQMTNPNSEGQQFTRNRFTQVREVAALLAKYAPDTFEVYKVMQSEYNARTSHGMIESKLMDPFALADLLEAWNFTRGDAYPIDPTLQVGSSSDNEDGTWEVHVSWPWDSGNPAQTATDKTLVLVFNPDTSYVAIIDTGSERQDEATVANIPVPTSGKNYFTVFAQSPDGTIVSTQTALGTLDFEGTLAAI